mmetsp:Transcript_4968/g.8551  ORF Transcript_4968/g.8551 Transcript_4968/m.8551 type:complete len:98 (+) Transcript_4968:1641-1934(+)
MFSVVKIPADDRSIDEESAAEFVIKLLAVSKSPSGSGHMESADGWFVCVFLSRILLRGVVTGAKANVAWGSAHTQTDNSRVEIFMAVLKVFVSLQCT